MADTNPVLLKGFAVEEDSLKEDIPAVLSSFGWSLTNSKINGKQLNTIFNQIFGYLNFLQSKGLSFWQEDKPYVATASYIDIVRRGNKIYFAKQDSNLDPVNNPAPKAPESNLDYWGVLLDLDNPPALGNHNHNGVYALLAGSEQQLFKVKDAQADNEAVSKSQMENFVNGQTKFVEKRKDISGDIDLVLTGGIYAYSSTLTNLPTGAGLAGSLLVSQGISTSARSQLLISSNGNVFFRYGDNAGWNTWRQLVKDSDFAQSLATEGYQKLPSGLFLQWGVTTTGTSGTETFPIAFPNACFGVQITNNTTNNSGFVSTFSTTAFNWSNLNTVVNRYFAIGY